MSLLPDTQLLSLIQQEEQRQGQFLRLIPSENFVSQNVRNILGSMLVNKYSEGYPNQRYYEGTEIIDKIEDLARERAKNLFGAEHSNVQAYSGSPANMAVYYALLPKGGTILGMGLTDGGHLTHGATVNYSSRYYKAVSYHVDSNTGWLNIDDIRKIAKDCHPDIIICGGSAYPRIIDFQEFQSIAQEVGAKLLVDMAHFAGLVAAQVYPSPIQYADFVTMTTHKVLRGPRGAIILCRKQYAKDIDRAVFPGLQGGPHNHTIAAIAMALYEANTPAFRKYGQKVVENAKALANALLKKDYNLVSGGTDTHLMLIDLRNKKISGKVLAQTLSKAGIITNANTIPNEPGSPKNPSGLRIGTPGVTTQGMGVQEMEWIAEKIDTVVKNLDNNDILEKVRAEVQEVTLHFGTEPKFE